MSQVADKLNKWELILGALSGYELDVFLQHYSEEGKKILLSKDKPVRAGSVIFLVGVGSLVCWRLWNYWHETRGCSGGSDHPHDYPPPKVRSNKAKNIFATFLEEEFVQDIRDFEDDDPALIQQLVELAKVYMRRAIVGRYFGPESPVEHGTPHGAYSSLCSTASDPNSSKRYHADNSASFSADEDKATINSDIERESLPFDSPIQYNPARRFKRRLGASQGRRSESSSPTCTPKRLPKIFRGSCSELVNDGHGRLCAASHPYELHTSFTADDKSAQIRPTTLRLVPRCQGDGSETVTSDAHSSIDYKMSGLSKTKRGSQTQFANYNSEEDWECDSSYRLRPEGEEQYVGLDRNSRHASLNNMMERFRQRTHKRKPLSRDASAASNLSDLLTSPAGARLLYREESVGSNFSDFTPSECSEFSLDLAMPEEGLASHTLSYLVDIEHELDTLKSSVVEMDEEFFRYASRPNPYLLKTTFSDYSLDGSRPGSELRDMDTFDKRRDSELDRKILGFMQKSDLHSSSGQSGGDHSLDWDSPQHGWDSASKPAFPKAMQRRSSSAGGLTRSASQDPPSLEWDNCGLKKYEEDETKHNSKRDLNWHLFLPDHACLELDLEEELQSSDCKPSLSQLELCRSPLRKTFEIPPKPDPTQPIMTMSVDSAICSAPGSRSGSMSPVSQALSQSMMSSGLGTSFIETSPDANLTWPSDCEQDCQDSQETFIPECPQDYSANPNGVNNNMGNTCSDQNHDSEKDVYLPASWTQLESIGAKVDIETYAAAEWQGTTPKARIIRKGYLAIPSHLEAGYLRKIRGDNYCGIRGTLYQLLSSGIALPSANKIYHKLNCEIHKRNSWLKHYNFGGRLKYSSNRITVGFKTCLDTLENLANEMRGLENGESVLRSRLNADMLLDVRVCEAAKLHMLAACMDLHQQSLAEAAEDLPFFAVMLFVRETSATPKDFLLNHLNAVGDTAGLEQVEMFLLGHALQVTIQVVRPSCIDSEDYICFFPDTNMDNWPKVSMIAEDDRHYNILVS